MDTDFLPELDDTDINNIFHELDDDSQYSDHTLTLSDPWACNCGGTYIKDLSEYICDKCNECSPIDIDNVFTIKCRERSAYCPLTTLQKNNLLSELRDINSTANNKYKFDENILHSVINIFSIIKGFIGEVRNDNRRRYLGACLLYVCNENDVAITNSAAKKYFKVLNRNVNSAYTNVCRIMNEINKDQHKKSKCESFLIGICNKFNIDELITKNIVKDGLYACKILEDRFNMTKYADTRYVASAFLALRLNHIKIKFSEFAEKLQMHLETVKCVIIEALKYPHLFEEWIDRD